MNPSRHRARRLAASAIYDGAFKMRVDTSLAGSAGDTFVLPLPVSGQGVAYNAHVSWGDGSSQRITGQNLGSITHVYPTPGQYVVSIKEVNPRGFPQIYFFNGGDKAKVLEIMQWGTITWQALTSAFFGCSNLVISATDEAKAITGGVASMLTMFRGCTSLRRAPRFNTKSVTTFSGLFNGCSSLVEAPAYDTSAATNLSQMYYGCSGIKSFPMIQTSLVTDWSLMFYNCSGLNGYDFPTLDMRGITNGTNFMYGVNISKASYNSMLDQLANGRGGIPAAAATGVAFRCDAHYDGSTGGYDGTTARGYLTGTKTWTITDGGTP